jgi:hypothetical protein
MATAVATRRRIERLEGRLCPVSVPADPTTLKIVRFLWLRLGQGERGVVVVKPGEIREAIARALRRNRGRGGLSSAVVHSFVYGYDDLDTDCLRLDSGRLPPDWPTTIWLCDQEDGEYVGAHDGKYMRIRVLPDRVLVRRDGMLDWQRWESTV